MVREEGGRKEGRWERKDRISHEGTEGERWEGDGGREGGRGRRKRVTEEGKGDWYIVPQKVDRQL